MTKKKKKTTLIKRNTADLIVHHSEQHLARRPHLRLLTRLPNLSRLGNPVIFALAGICVLLVAFQIVNSSTADPAFLAENATDYAAQEAFYADSEEPLHAAASNYAAAREVVHEAAVAAELSQALNVIGLALIALVLWYLQREHGIFSSAQAGFHIRRIR
ncbi:MAG: hypothetical protein ABIH35_03005 [Patescibacteria group bacterium]